jgi:hypothetical protein
VAKALAGCWGEQSGNVASELANLFEAARDYARAAEYYQVAAEHPPTCLPMSKRECLPGADWPC